MTKAAGGQSSLKALKIRNRHAVLELLRHSDAPLAVAEAAGLTSLSKMTVHQIIRHHVRKGLARECGKGPSGGDGGKRPTLFAFNADYRFIFCLRISSLSLHAAVANLRAELRASQEVRFDRPPGLEETLEQIRSLFLSLTRQAAFRRENCAGIVAGCHGITDSESGVIATSPHFPDWGTNIPIRRRLREIFPFPAPVRVDNWIRYLAYGELKAGRDSDKSFIIIGTEYEGLAAGLVMDGVLRRGARGLAGEVGHLVVAPGSPELCVCGGAGCLEAMVSLRRMEERAWARRDEWGGSRVFAAGRGKKPDYSRIFAAANAGDAFARLLLDEAARHFAVGVNNIVQVCDPGLVVIHGEYAKAGDYFLGRLRRFLRGMSLLRMDKGTRVEYSALGAEWPMAGAAHQAADLYFGSAPR